ncbi:MAG: hypothetical protein ACYCWW_01180 [Deltaproteobacteria bacterium]
MADRHYGVRAVLKICPACHRTFSGGRKCLDCTEVGLLDVADARTQPHLRRADLQHTINTYYGARSAMLLLFASLLLGGLGALLLARQGVVRGPGWPWFVAAGLALVGIPAVGLLAGAVVVRLFGVCRGGPQTLDDLRATLRAAGRGESSGGAIES